MELPDAVPAEVLENLNRYSENDSEDFDKVAAKRGAIVVPGDDHHLQLDWDSTPTEAHDSVDEIISAHLELLGRRLVTTSPGGRKHVYIKLTQPLGLSTRILLQLALGSDPKREILSLIRKRDPKLMLFEMPKEYARVRPFLAGENL